MVVKEPRSVLVLDELRTLNDANDKLRNEIRVTRESRERAEMKIASIKAEAYIKARNAVNDEGKTLNTNDTLRNAAVEHELSHNKGYRDMLVIANQQDIDIAVAKQMLEHHAGEWRILLAEVELLVAQITASANAAVMNMIGEV